MTTDRIKYEVFYRLWTVWHCRLPRFKLFMKRIPAKYYGVVRGRQLTEPAHYRHWETVNGNARPFFHICCNGNAGGWRTHLCDWLEHKWRSTKYYETPPREESNANDA